MTRSARRLPLALLSAAFCSVVLFVGDATAAEPTLELQSGDRIVLVGNTFAERMIKFGNFETIVTLARPELDLVFRNLGWSADEVTFQRMYVPGHASSSPPPAGGADAMLQPRPLNFGDMESHLARQQANVVFLCFGMNESFRGPAGLAKFEADLVRMIGMLRDQQFNGETPPRLVLVSPIAHERMGRNLPDPTEHNENLAAYTDIMRQVAASEEIPFVDLFTPLSAYVDAPENQRLTFNGIHLTAYGDWVVSQLMAEQLGLAPPAERIEVDARGRTARATGAELGEVAPTTHGFALRVRNFTAPVASAPEGAAEHPAALNLDPELMVKNLAPGQYTLKLDGETAVTASADQWAAGVRLPGEAWRSKADELREATVDKNEQFFYRWRSVNGEYIYGRRAEPFGVKSFPPEMQRLDEMVAERDGRIHTLAKRPDERYLELERSGE